MLLTAIGNVMVSGSVSTSRGRRNAFQLVTMVSTAIVLSTGRDNGSMIDQ